MLKNDAYEAHGDKAAPSGDTRQTPNDRTTTLPDPAIVVVKPEKLTSPAIFASPHSGRAYPTDLIEAARLDPLSLRRSEDGFVDEIFQDAPAAGSPLLCALFPRAYVDVNREAFELDPRMFADPLPSYVNSRSTRVAAGLGAIPRIVAEGAEIYRRKLTFAEAKRRIQRCHTPYHAALTRLIDAAKTAFGGAIVIDCHSMPSCGGVGDGAGGPSAADIVLGDRYGGACAAAVTDLAEQTLSGLGYRVARNAPYAGGYTTSHYGKPDKGVNALQIEINRGLYMDESAMRLLPGFANVRADMRKLIDTLGAVDISTLNR
ncbi:MAG: N-formylglutamate amidohydrolase [Pseudomonadota bacterium]